MRLLRLACVLTLGFGLIGDAVAQSALEEPLAAPDAAQPKQKPKQKPAKTGHHKTNTTRHETSSNPVDATGYSPQGPQPVVHTHRDTPSDPVSLGMKWNGSNDTARDTRVQNYDGSAPGTGGEVGLKLHF